MPEMTMEIDISSAVAGFDQLNFPARRRIITASKRAAGNILRKRAAELAPVGSYSPNDKKVIGGYRSPGSLKRSLKRAKTGLTVTRRNKAVFVVAGLSEEDPYYAWWVDQGHTIRRERKGPIFGHVKGKKFMEAAAADVGPQTLQAFQKRFFKGVDTALKKARNLRR